MPSSIGNSVCTMEDSWMLWVFGTVLNQIISDNNALELFKIGEEVL